MSVLVLMVLTVIHMRFVNFAIALNASANLHTLSLEKVAFWRDVQISKNAHLELNASQLLEEFHIVPVQKDSELNWMDRAPILTSVLRINKLVVMMEFVPTQLAVLLATALTDTMEMLIMAYARQHKRDALQIKNVVQTLSACNQVNAYAHHHSS